MALEEEFEYLCKLLSNILIWNFHFSYLAFRCAYCNYFNSARKNKPVFNPDLFNSPQTQIGSNIERMEISTMDTSNDPINDSKISRRSIRVPTINPNSSIRQHHPDLSSSEESLSDKNKWNKFNIIIYFFDLWNKENKILY
jgi:hypothetical protein